jgi:hypothetical protein
MFEVGGSTSAVLGTFMVHGGAAIDEARLTVRLVALAETETWRHWVRFAHQSKDTS